MGGLLVLGGLVFVLLFLREIGRYIHDERLQSAVGGFFVFVTAGFGCVLLLGLAGALPGLVAGLFLVGVMVALLWFIRLLKRTHDVIRRAQVQAGDFKELLHQRWPGYVRELVLGSVALLLVLFGNVSWPSRPDVTLSTRKSTGGLVRPPSRAEPIQVGQEIAIAGPTLDGGQYQLNEFRGKVVLVDFWATWCGPCVAELPILQSVYDRHHDAGFEIVGVSLDKSRKSLEGFVKEQGIPWPQIFFDQQESTGWENPLGRKYGIRSIPATFLINTEGKVAVTNVRGLRLEPEVVKLLGVKPASAQETRNDTVKIYSERIASNPKDSSAYLSRARAHYDQRKWKQAVADYGTAFELGAGSAYTHTLCARCRMSLKDYEGARKDLQRALELQPGYGEAYHQRGHLHHHLKDWEPAIADFEEALRQKPGDRHLLLSQASAQAGALWDQAVGHAREGAWDDAAASARTCLETARTGSYRWERAALFMVLSGDLSTYESHCRKMMEQFAAPPKYLGDYGRAVEVCCLVPQPAWDLNDLKRIAEKAVTESASSRSEPAHLCTLALVYLRRQEYEQALDVISRSDHANWTSGKPRFETVEVSNRAIESLCRAKQGAWDDARAALASAGSRGESAFAELSKIYDQGIWPSWVTAQILCNEARALLASAQPPEPLTETGATR